MNTIPTRKVLSKHILAISILVFSFFMQSCKGKQNENNIQNDSDTIKKEKTETPKQASQQEYDLPLITAENKPISKFVRRIFQDKKGNLWFGTNGDGVKRYNRKSLEGFSLNEGFKGRAVRGIIEDNKRNISFGTESGLIKYDGNSFTLLTEKDGLANNDIWSLTIDNKGIIWIGTLQGAC